MPFSFVEISESGVPYFYEFYTDTCETSHTVFTPFTRHEIERFHRYIWCLNKRHANGEKVSLDKNFSMNFPYLLTFVIREKSLPNSQMCRVANKWC